MPWHHPEELQRLEVEHMFHQIRGFGHPLPHIVITGGDPLERADIFSLIEYATAAGLSVSITPSVTPHLTRAAIEHLKERGVSSIGLSLDGSSPDRHDALRGIPGCFQWTMDAMTHAAATGLPIQVNSMVSQETVDDLPFLYTLLRDLPIMRWSVFFLIPVGRGQQLQSISSQRCEEILHWLYEISQEAPFAVKTTEAPHYRRVALTRMEAEGRSPAEIQRSSVYQGFGIRDGHGIMFISHTGDIYPAGFLPIRVGNIRMDHLVTVYREAPLFQALHDPAKLKGKCGHCRYRAICGGSRARAWAVTGDPLESDPLCAYQPV
jgi:radical SAM protein